MLYCVILCGLVGIDVVFVMMMYIVMIYVFDYCMFDYEVFGARFRKRYYLIVSRRFARCFFISFNFSFCLFVVCSVSVYISIFV